MTDASSWIYGAQNPKFWCCGRSAAGRPDYGEFIVGGTPTCSGIYDDGGGDDGLPE